MTPEVSNLRQNNLSSTFTTPRLKIANLSPAVHLNVFFWVAQVLEVWRTPLLLSCSITHTPGEVSGTSLTRSLHLGERNRVEKYWCHLLLLVLMWCFISRMCASSNHSTYSCDDDHVRFALRKRTFLKGPFTCRVSWRRARLPDLLLLFFAKGFGPRDKNSLTFGTLQHAEPFTWRGTPN